MNKKNINIPFLLLCFYMYFPFLFKGIGSYQLIIVYGISYVGILFNIQKLKKYITTEYIVCAFFCYVIVFLASIFIPLGYGTNDFSYTNKLISILNFSAKSVFLIAIFIRIHKENAKPDLYIKYYILSCCILVCTTIFFLIFPSLKYFWRDNIIYQSIYDLNASKETNYIARYSIIGFSGFRQTFMCTISYILTLYLILSKSDVMKNTSKYIILIFSVLGTFFYGRIGLVVILVDTLILIPFLFIKKPKILFTLIISVIVLMFIINIIKINNEKLKYWYNWAFALFINYSETGELRTGSSDILFHKMYFKIDTNTFLVGDGLYTTSTGGYYMRNRFRINETNLILWNIFYFNWIYDMYFYNIWSI